MKRRLLSILLAALLLAGCAGPPEESEGPRQYQVSYLNLFDTVTTISGFAESEAAFHAGARAIHDTLLEYHRLFDIYNDYEGLNNLKTVNDHAGVAPVEVDGRIIELLLDCRAFYEATGGRVNAAMGSVLALWHDARSAAVDDPENARLPDWEALEEAAAHVSFDTIVIDEEASTVYIADPLQRLDVGAIAKGWAAERAARSAPPGMLLVLGGNVRATGPKPDAPWVVGIQVPDGARDEYLHTLNLSHGSVVSSGDYQRYFTVDGARYHHIIDPDTLYPATYWRVVTVVCGDSGAADALSTALFTLPREEGEALLRQFGAEAMWMAQDGTLHYSPGFAAHIRS